MTRKSPSVFALHATALLLGAAAAIVTLIWLRLHAIHVAASPMARVAAAFALPIGLTLGPWAGRLLAARGGGAVRLLTASLIGLAASACLAPWIAAAAGALLATAYHPEGGSGARNAYVACQIAFTLALFVPPAALLGGALAALAPARGDSPGPGTKTPSGPLAAAAFGVALGAAGAFFALPAWGPIDAGFLAAGLFAAASVIGRAACDPPRRARGAPAPPALASRSGFAALRLGLDFALAAAACVMLIAMIRFFRLLAGPTLATSIILMGAIAPGVAAGALLAARVKAFAARPGLALWFAGALLAAGGGTSVAIAGGLPARFIALAADAAERSDVPYVSHLIIASLLLLPMSLTIGVLLAARIAPAPGAPARPSPSVARSLALVSFAAACALLLTALLLAARGGMRRSIFAAAGLACALAIARDLLARPPWRGAALRASAASVPLILAALLAPPWNYALLSSGPYVNGPTIAGFAGPRADAPAFAAGAERALGRLVNYAEGSGAIVSIRDDRGMRYLENGGRTVGVTRSRASSALAHLAMALHERPREALVLGLGSGEVLQSVLTYPTLLVADCVEPSAEIVAKAAQFFSGSNGGALTHGRKRLILNDPRNHLSHGRASYDAIVMDGPEPWVAAGAPLYTIEAFAAMRDALYAGGIAAIRLHNASDPETIPMILRAWRTVFPNAYLFQIDGEGSYALLGLKTPATFSITAIRRAMSAPAAMENLKEVRILDPADLIGHLVLDGAAMKAFAGEGPVARESSLAIEMREVPHGAGIESAHDLLVRFDAARVSPATLLGAEDLPEDIRAAFERRFEAIEATRPLALEAMRIERTDGQNAYFRVLLGRIGRLNERDPFLLHRLGANPGLAR